MTKVVLIFILNTFGALFFNGIEQTYIWSKGTFLVKLSWILTIVSLKTDAFPVKNGLVSIFIFYFQQLFAEWVTYIYGRGLLFV